MLYIKDVQGVDITDNDSKSNNNDDGVDLKESENEKEKERQLTFLEKVFNSLNKSSKINTNIISSFKSYLFENQCDSDGLRYDVSSDDYDYDDDDDDDYNINNSNIGQFFLLEKQEKLFKRIPQIIEKIGFVFFSIYIKL